MALPHEFRGSENGNGRVVVKRLPEERTRRTL
jgi:hypothetical protein